jgi:hypothetical protein
MQNNELVELLKLVRNWGDWAKLDDNDSKPLRAEKLRAKDCAHELHELVMKLLKGE